VTIITWESQRKCDTQTRKIKGFTWGEVFLMLRSIARKHKTSSLSDALPFRDPCFVDPRPQPQSAVLICLLVVNCIYFCRRHGTLNQ